jgi:hypothetical protein
MMEFFSSPCQTGAEAHPLSYSMVTIDSCPGIKRPRREAFNSPPSSTKVKNVWSYTSTLEYIFMAWCIIKKEIGKNFHFYLALVKVKVRFSPCFYLTEHHGMKAYWGSEGIAPRILNLGTTER